MRQSRCYLALLICVSPLILTGALPWPSQPPGPPPALSTEDTAATQLLDRAIERLGPGHLPALETQIWQRIHLSDLDYEAAGRLLQGPNRRYRLELNTQIGGAAGTLLMVSDGQTLWHGIQLGPRRWTDVSRQPINGQSAAFDQSSGRSPNLSPFPFGGIEPFLRQLRDRLVWSHGEDAKLESSACFRLTGAWSPKLMEILARDGQPWPEGVPTQCQLWLDAGTLWPRRLEWRGPRSASEPNVLLVEMELRAPEFNPDLSPERCRTEFTFNARYP